MFKKNSIWGIVFFLIASCTNPDNPTDISGESLVKGFLMIQNKPVADASVQIDDVLNWKATTDTEGFFEIKNVTTGQHVIKSFKNIENGKSITLESSIAVSGDITDLGYIRLPEPPVMYPIDSTQVTEYSIPLNWSQTDDPEFREYKVYRKDDPGIDETTGELIFVSTSEQDTTFIDSTFNAGLTYYYRVYILSAFGKLGGSNVVSTQTPEKLILINGDFEESDTTNSIPGWDEFNLIVELDSITVANGKYSLRAKKEENAMGDFNINQDIPGSKFIANQTYIFSLKMKSQNTEMGAFILYYYNGLHLITPNLKIFEGEDWTELSSEFQVPSEATVVTVRLWMTPFNSAETIGWFDDVIITIL